jgi:hydroxymethylpyrimidine/phosphomethylpyrimidine kinase
LNRQPPVALTIAGSDSSAGAGIQADLKTFAAHHVYGVSAVTCVVAETPGRVVNIAAVDPENVRAQIEVLLESFPIHAAKTGLLHTSAIVQLVASVFRKRGIPLVVDPVMVATSGDVMLQRDAIARYEAELFPLATLITPNMDEAAHLLGRAIRTTDDMLAGVETLARKYSTAVLLKGGHLLGDRAIDFLFADGSVHKLEASFVRRVATHGTGCTYSAAIAAQLALGEKLPEAVVKAKQFVTRAIEQHFAWRDSLNALNHDPNE